MVVIVIVWVAAIPLPHQDIDGLKCIYNKKMASPLPTKNSTYPFHKINSFSVGNCIEFNSINNSCIILNYNYTNTTCYSSAYEYDVFRFSIRKN